MLKIAFASSVGQLSATPFATFTNVSIPTTSAVRNVADLGRPIIGPVSASISSTFNCNFSMAFIIAIIPKTPTRFAINAGVSLHNTVVLPSCKLPYSIKKSTTNSSVCGVGIISNKRKYLGGLKKCVPQKCFLKSSLLPSAILCIGIPDVLDVINVPGLRYFSTSIKTACFISNRSTTTSITQSHSAISFILSVKFPVFIFLTTFLV